MRRQDGAVLSREGEEALGVIVEPPPDLRTSHSKRRQSTSSYLSWSKVDAGLRSLGSASPTELRRLRLTYGHEAVLARTKVVRQHGVGRDTPCQRERAELKCF